MKKTVFFVLLAVMLVFCVSAQTYRLEIWDVSNNTYDGVVRNTNNGLSLEDNYVFVRNARGTTSRSIDVGLSIEEVRQKLRSIDSRSTDFGNFVNNSIIPSLQTNSLYSGWFRNSTRTITVFIWVRRQF